jgi:hypothetical protein
MLTPEILRERLISSGLCEPAQLRGCSEKDLETVEKHMGTRLPEEYKKVLRVLGKGAGDFCSDVKMYYPDIITLTDRARRLLSDYGTTLPETAFVFASRDGEQMLLFHVGDNDADPEIYRWSDEKPTAFRKVFKSIWGFIEEQLDSHEMMLQEPDEGPEED